MKKFEIPPWGSYPVHMSAQWLTNNKIRALVMACLRQRWVKRIEVKIVNEGYLSDCFCLWMTPNTIRKSMDSTTITIWHISYSKGSDKGSPVFERAQHMLTIDGSRPHRCHRRQAFKLCVKWALNWSLLTRHWLTIDS